MRSRAFGLTVSLDKVSQNDFMVLCDLCNVEFASLKGFTIGHSEVGESSDYQHFHALLYFDNPIQLDSVISFFPNIHVEVVQSYKRYRDYLKKDGPFFYDSLNNCTLDADIVNDLMSCKDFKEFIILHPNVISQIKNYRIAFELLRSNSDDK